MRSHDPGKVKEGLWYLGRPETGVYWIEGTERAMILSGGMSYIAPIVVKQIQEFGLDEDRLHSVLILHAHFDHIGIIPFMRQRYPKLKIRGSHRAWKILENPQAISTINQFSRTIAERAGQSHVYTQYDLDWPEGITGEAVTEDHVISLGDVRVRVLDTPGHSSCSISAYVPEWKALFASDGGGIPYEGSIVISANSNFTKYQQSLEKLQALDVDFICADHFGYVYGEEAKGFIAHAIELAAKERAHVEEVYARTRDVEAAAKEIAEAFFVDNPNYFLSRDIFEGVSRQILKHIAKCMEEGS
jgi:glyoxylase-like metal-dependent hydrolase (beta-lactamase superfamily II)